MHVVTIFFMKQKLCTKWGRLDADVDWVDVGICRYTGEINLWLQRCNLDLSLCVL